MSHDTDTTEKTTRRDYIGYGSAVLGGGLLTGCTGDGNRGNPGATTETATQTTTEDDSYSVSMTEYHDLEEIRTKLAEHEVASEITAVQEGNVYAQGARRQGPLLNLFQTEMTAKRLYPGQFGRWPGYVDGDPYPEISEEKRLFDRERVVDVINGNFES